jgi:hypothetical protein
MLSEQVYKRQPVRDSLLPVAVQLEAHAAMASKRARSYRVYETEEMQDQGLMTIAANTVTDKSARGTRWDKNDPAVLFENYGDFNEERDSHTAMRDLMITYNTERDDYASTTLGDLPNAQSSLSGVAIYKGETAESVASRCAFAGISYTHHDDNETQETRNRITTAVHGLLTLRRVHNAEEISPGDLLEWFLPSTNAAVRATQYATIRELKGDIARVVPLIRKKHNTTVTAIIDAATRGLYSAHTFAGAGTDAAKLAEYHRIHKIAALHPNASSSIAPTPKETILRAFKGLVALVAYYNEAGSVQGTANQAQRWGLGGYVNGDLAVDPNNADLDALFERVVGVSTISQAAFGGMSDADKKRYVAIQNLFPTFVRVLTDAINQDNRQVFARAVSYGRSDNTVEALVN